MTILSHWKYNRICQRPYNNVSKRFDISGFPDTTKIKDCKLNACRLFDFIFPAYLEISRQLNQTVHGMDVHFIRGIVR